ncbi:MAG: hypothetical protein HUJ71_07175 [Pseudobutyrivibrio sp.]|nr:hypothetical protein [Pseudobutyrivibrio sp.]
MIKKIRSIFLLILSMVLVMIFSMTSYAQELSTEGIVESKSDVVDYLNSVDFGTAITFNELPNDVKENNTLLQFDSIEEAEVYIQKLLDERKEIMYTSYSAPKMLKLASNTVSAADGWKEGTVSWWGGGNTSLLSLTNAMIRHYYSNGNISKITVQDSYMTGIVGATWTHRRGTGTAIGGTKVKISVTGTWFIGLDIKGFPIGASFDETINSPEMNITVR